MAGITPATPSPYGPGVPGRPVKNTKYTLLPIDGSKGWKFNDTDPDVMKRVHKQYLDKYEFPPGLKPARPRITQNLMNKAISRGFKKPKDGR